MPNAGFVHLHVHSAYSLLKGSIKIAKLGELAKADRQPALALTDTDNMFGALEFSDKMAGYGIQPIIGCELAVDFGDQDASARNALGLAYSRLERFADALDQFDRAVALAPTFAGAHVARGQALEALGLLLQTAGLLVRKLQARNKLGILCQQILHVLEGLEHERILTCFVSAMHQLTC